jgi:hypothetical protein
LVKVETVADGSKQVVVSCGQRGIQRRVTVIPGPAGMNHLVLI